MSSSNNKNVWEQADFGADDRKNKFLRLMGASKVKDPESSSNNKATLDPESSSSVVGDPVIYNKGTKRPAPDSTTEKHEEDLHVKSANAWEQADFGADDRKNKFLRLMGASKKDHHGRFVIGDKEKAEDRAAGQKKNLTEELETQYEQGLQHKRESGWRGHLGLGFHKEEKPKDVNPGGDTGLAQGDTDVAQCDADVTSSKDSTDKPSDSQVTTSQSEDKPTEKSNDSHPDSSSSSKPPSAADKYRKMGFVKAS